MQEKTLVAKYNSELNIQLADAATQRALLATTFKGLTPVLMRQAMLEGMIRGFTFQNFLQKDVYAVPFGNSYSLVTAIDYNRKIGMRSGVLVTTKPNYTSTEVDGKKVV